MCMSGLFLIQDKDWENVCEKRGTESTFELPFLS